jgi:hypothetical protein
LDAQLRQLTDERTEAERLAKKHAEQRQAELEDAIATEKQAVAEAAADLGRAKDEGRRAVEHMLSKAADASLQLAKQHQQQLEDAKAAVCRPPSLPARIASSLFFPAHASLCMHAGRFARLFYLWSERSVYGWLCCTDGLCRLFNGMTALHGTVSGR